MKYTFFCWLGFVSLTSYAQAVDMTVFGIPLAEKFAIPECEKKTIGSSAFYREPTTAPCFERLYGKEKDTDPIINGAVEIKFPSGECFGNLLMVSALCSVYGDIIDGNLEGISFGTVGLSAADYVLSVLKQKYGKPTSLIPSKAQNMMGATFNKFTAIWDLPKLYVEFDSLSSTVDKGSVSIETRKSKEERERKRKEFLKNQRPL